MRLFYTLLAFSLLCTPFFLAAQNINPETVSKKLLERLASEPGAMHSVHVVLADRVDLVTLDEQLTAQRALPEQRAETVILALKNKAAETQGLLFSKIKNSPAANPGTVRSFWVANAIFAEMKTELVAELSRRPDVAWIGLNGKLEMESVTMAPTPPVAAPGGREIGLSVIGAPALWAMGYTGYGQLAFTNDTGVDPDVPAYATKYRGFYAPTSASFFNYDEDVQGQELNTEPFDCGYHGTHVNGTIVGLERLTNDTIGVAFNAQWIGAAILCGLGTEDNVAAFQWSLDPDGNPATADDIPDIINNSWYDPSLDTLDCFSVYIPVSEAMEAAGIAVVYSAGNAGPEVGTITQPHNINLNLVNAFTVGALNGNSASLPIANFSSRGPSHCTTSDSSLLIKPEVSAPGVDVRSCLPDGYGLLSGTSMASPHVSGAILLLKEAFPYLPGKEFKLALYYTAHDLGQPGEDNTFGMGVINVLDAFNYLVAQGHVPVSPHVANDVLVVDLQLPSVACEEEVSPILFVENGGSDTLTSFTIDYEVGNTSNSIIWTGSLAQKERAKINLPTLSVAEGNYRLRVSLSNPNGVADERPLNDVFEKSVEVLSRLRLDAQAEGSAMACEGEQVLLRANYDGPGYATVKWYDAQLGGNLVGQGTVFTTPVMLQTDTFFAEAHYVIPAGLVDKNTSPNAIFDEDEGLVFNAERAFKLKSVKVFAEQTGLRQIQLYDDEGEEIEHAILNVNQVGEFVLNLNWEVPAGNGFRLIRTGGKPLYSNTTGISFPIEQPGLVSITGTTDGANDAYYYFYDWQIEIPEPCERTAVIVPVNPVGSMPGASFSVSTDSIDLTDNQPVQFTNTSTDNVASFDWNFGDGTGSNLESPEHTYTEPGLYIVSLAITSLDGCTSFALDTIEVTSNGVSGLNDDRKLPENVAVYPNPTSESVNVRLDLHTAKMVELQLCDITGKQVRSKTWLASQNELTQFDIADLTTGVYFLTVKMDGNSSVWKVVKI